MPTPPDDPNAEIGVSIDGVALRYSDYREVLSRYPGITFDPKGHVLQFREVSLRRQLVISQAMTIRLVGENRLIYEDDGMAAIFSAHVVVEGAGRILISNPAGTGLALGEGLVLDGAEMRVHGATYGVRGPLGRSNSNMPRLEVKSGSFYALGGRAYSISSVELAMKDPVKIQYPEGAMPDPDQGTVQSNGKAVRGEPVMISEAGLEKHAVKLLGVPMNTATMAFPLRYQAPALQRGDMTYDPRNGNITLRNASVEDASEPCVEVQDGKDCLLRLWGENSIAGRQSAISVVGESKLHIAGPGQLEIRIDPTSKKPAVLVGSAEGIGYLKVFGGQVTIEAHVGISGIHGERTAAEVRVMDGGKLSIEATAAAMEGLVDVPYDSHEPPMKLEPAGPWKVQDVMIDGEQRKSVLVSASSEIIRKLSISPEDAYPVFIGGVQIAKGHIHPDNGVLDPSAFPCIKRGAVFYKRSTDEILLDNAIIELDGDDPAEYAIESRGSHGLKVLLSGKSEIRVSRKYSRRAAIYAEGGVRFGNESEDPASLTVHGAGTGIWAKSLSLSGAIHLHVLPSAGEDLLTPVRTEKLALSGSKARMHLYPGDGRQPIETLGMFTASMESGLEVLMPDGGQFGSNGLLDKNGEVVRGEQLLIAQRSDFSAQYGFSIAGVPITSLNYQRLAERENGQAIIPGLTLGQGGYIRYVADEKKLYLHNVTLNTKDRDVSGIDISEAEGMTISLSGQNAILAKQSALHLGKSATLSGGRLFMEGAYLVRMSQSAQLTLADAYLIGEGEFGMVSDDKTGRCAILGNTTLSISTENEVVENLAAFDLAEGLRAIRPVGATFDPGKKVFVDKGGETVAGANLLIGNAGASLGIFIGDQELTMANYQQISPAQFPGMKSGTATYDPESNRLTLKDFEGTISNLASYVTIVAQGTSTLFHKSRLAGYFTSLEGDGALIYQGQTLETHLEVNEGVWILFENYGGIDGRANGYLDVKGGNVIVSKGLLSFDTRPIVRNIPISMEMGSKLLWPLGASYAGEKIMKDGAEVTGCVIIAKHQGPSYGLEISGVPLNDAFMRAYQIAKYGFINGNFAYDPAQRVLTLFEASHLGAPSVSEEGLAVRSGVKGLHIAFDLPTLKCGSIELLVDATFGGIGSIDGKDYPAVILHNSKLSIADGAKLAFSSRIQPMKGYSSNRLHVGRAEATFTNSQGGQLFANMSEITLASGTQIIEPLGAQITSGQVMVNANPATSRVIFGDGDTPLGLAIGGKQVTLANYKELNNRKIFPMITNGEVTYDREARKLVMAGITTIKGSLESQIQGLTIEVKGDRCVISEGMDLSASTFIGGDANLILEGEQYKHLELRSDVSLTIGGKVQLAVAHSLKKEYGASNTQLIVRENATLLVGGNVSVDNLQLADGQAIQVPASAGFDAHGSDPGIKISEGGSYTSLARHVIIATERPEPYGIFIGGIEINKLNESYMQPGYFDAIKSGIVELSVDGTTGEPVFLALRSAEVQSYQESALRIVDGCKIQKVKIYGECILESQGNKPAILYQKSGQSIYFYGENNALLRLNSGNGAGIFLDNVHAKIAFSDMAVKVQGRYGFRGTMGPHNRPWIEVKNSNVQVDSKEGAVRALAFSWSGCELEYPKDGEIKKPDYDLVDAEGNVSNQLHITTAGEQEEYGFSLGGVPITSRNAPFIGSLPIFRNPVKLSYDPSTKTLRVGGIVSIDAEKLGLGLEDGAELNIEIERDASFRVSGKLVAFAIGGTLSCSGQGDLQLKGESAFGLSDGASVTLSGISTYASGQSGAIVTELSGEDKTASFTLRSGTFRAESSIGPAISGLTTFSIADNMSITPSGAAYSAEKRVLCIGDQVVRGKVEIGYTNYGFMIGGVAVTGENLRWLTETGKFEAIKSGTVSFDPTTRTLKLKDARLATSEAVEGVLHIREDLTIVLEGSNAIEGEGAQHGIRLHVAKATIRGSGSLQIDAQSASAIALERSELRLESGSIRLSGAYAVRAEGSDDLLYLGQAAELQMQGRNGTIRGLNRFLRQGQIIVEPMGATYDAKIGAIVHEGKPVMNRPVRFASVSIEVEPKSIELYVGGSVELAVRITAPAGLPNGYKLSVNDPSVVEIDGSRVKAKAEGTAMVAVIPEISDEIQVAVPVVVNPYVAVTSVSLGEDFELFSGESRKLQPTILPDNASDKSLQWDTSNPGVATVADGEVMGISVGKATIMAKAANGISGTCVVTVKERPIQSIALSPSTLDLRQGQQQTISVLYTPATGVSKGVKWDTDNPGVATVADGVVMGIAAGKATITAISLADNSKKATCQVTVTAYVALTGIAFQQDRLVMHVGEKMTPTMVFTPANASNRKLSWHSDAEGVVTVSASGQLEAVAMGTATLTATSDDGGHTATCQVEVKDAIRVTGIALDSAQLTVKVNESKSLTVIFTPSDATDRSVEWTTSDEGVATVSGGTITGIALGTATITAKSRDGGYTAQCAVTVVESGQNTSVESCALAGAQVAPNPFGAQLLLRGVASLQRYDLVSAQGVVALSGAHNGAEELLLSTVDLPQGAYLLRLVAADGVRMVRLVKR